MSNIKVGYDDGTWTTSRDWNLILEAVHEFNDLLDYFKNVVSGAKDYPAQLIDDDFDGYEQVHWSIAHKINDVLMGEGGQSGYAANPILTPKFHYWTTSNFGKKSITPFINQHMEMAQTAQDIEDFWLGNRYKLTDTELSEDDTDEEDKRKEEMRREIGTRLLNRITRLTKEMEVYAQKINALFSQVYPERFKYEGFVVENPDHFAKPLATRLLDGIGFLKKYFRDTGLLKIFEKGIKKFVIQYNGTALTAESEWVAMYTQKEQKITIFESMDEGSYTRLLDDWVKEVFIHEFGHYIHMSYITGEAREFWDSWWETIEEARDIDDATDPLFYQERFDFYHKVVDNYYDVVHTYKKLRTSNEKMRFLAWLEGPGGRAPALIKKPTPNKPPKLTPFGKQVFFFMYKPWEAIEEDEDYNELDLRGTSELLQNRTKEYQNLLGLNATITGRLISKHLREAIRKNVSSAAYEIAQLGVPSNYAKTNVLEDFAESFVLFVTEPRRLSKLAQYRMKRTLSLSGLYGKPVMRFAEVIESLCHKDLTDDSRALLATFLEESN